MTNLTFKINKGDPEIAFGETGADYVDVNLTLDYLIWTAGSDAVKDGEDEPTQDELNQSYSIIDNSVDITIAHCLLFDYSESKLEEVEGMGQNKRYVFCFSFDGATASEPRLECWDDSNHDTTDKHVLGGGGTGYDSFVKGICTTLSLPGVDWAGSPIAGSNILLLNNGNGALDELITGEESQELYANLKTVIPMGYDTPAVENYVLTVRFTWM